MENLYILGMGPGSSLAPFEKGDRWGINQAYIYGKVDRLYFTHRDFRKFITGSDKAANESGISFEEAFHQKLFTEFHSLYYFELLFSGIDQVIYTSQPDAFLEEHGKADIKTIPLPTWEMSRIRGGTYYTCALCYLIAAAIWENKHRNIFIYGWEAMNYRGLNTYGYQYRGVSEWIRVALSLGIKVYLPWEAIIPINEKIEGSNV